MESDVVALHFNRTRAVTLHITRPVDLLHLCTLRSESIPLTSLQPLLTTECTERTTKIFLISWLAISLERYFTKCLTQAGA